MATSLIYWQAANALLPASNAPAGLYRAGTNYPSFTLAFAGNAGSADESAFFHAVVPDVYQGGTVFFRIYWEPATSSPAGENCSWDVSIIGRADDEAFDAAFTETQTVNDVVTAAADIQIASTATAAATLTAGDLVVIRILRDYDEANGGTALDEDALLHGFQLLET
jgi:hypothetical protein